MSTAVVCRLIWSHFELPRCHKEIGDKNNFIEVCGNTM